MPDIEIVCKECKRPFVFTEKDQAFYAKKNFTPPKACKPCREARKAQKDNGSEELKELETKIQALHEEMRQVLRRQGDIMQEMMKHPETFRTHRPELQELKTWINKIKREKMDLDRRFRELAKP